MPYPGMVDRTVEQSAERVDRAGGRHGVVSRHEEPHAGDAGCWAARVLSCAHPPRTYCRRNTLGQSLLSPPVNGNSSARRSLDMYTTCRAGAGEGDLGHHGSETPAPWIPIDVLDTVSTGSAVKIWVRSRS